VVAIIVVPSGPGTSPVTTLSLPKAASISASVAFWLNTPSQPISSASSGAVPSVRASTAVVAARMIMASLLVFWQSLVAFRV